MYALAVQWLWHWGTSLIGQIWCLTVYSLIERLVQSTHRGNCVFNCVVGDYAHQKTPWGQLTLIGFDLFHWPDLTKMKDALLVSWLVKNYEAILPFEKNWPCGETETVAQHPKAPEMVNNKFSFSKNRNLHVFLVRKEKLISGFCI